MRERATGRPNELHGQSDAPHGTGPATEPTGAGPEPTAGRPPVTSTGTTVVALAAEDATVLAADRRASVGRGRFVTGKDVRKVEQVHPTAATALSGSVGGIQSFVRALLAEADRYAADRGRRMSLHALATYAGGLLREGPYRAVQPLVAGVDDDGPAVFDLDPGGAVLPADYAAKGSGMQVAYGVLEGEYGPELSTAAAARAAASAVGAASARDTASGDGLTVATVTSEGVTTDVHDDPSEAMGAAESGPPEEGA